jgi:hypothetical protein
MSGRQPTITFRKNDLWLLETLERLVATKKRLGYKTTLSRELIRCAKNGLTNGLTGSDLDRQILLEDSNDTSENVS